MLLGQANGSISVLLISGDYPPRLGGAASHTYYLASGLARLGLRVSVLTSKCPDWPPGVERVRGHPTLRIIRANCDFSSISRIGLEPALQAALNVVRDSPPDIVHAQHLPATLIGLYLKSSFGFTLISTLHTTPRSPWNPSVVRELPTYSIMRSFMQERIDAFVATSECFHSELCKLRPEGAPMEIAFIPHGIAVGRFAPNRVGWRVPQHASVKSLDRGAVLVLVLARLDERKRLDLIPRAIHYLPQALRERILVWITGEAEDAPQRIVESELKALASASGMDPQHLVFQSVSFEALPAVIRAASALVLPSDREGLGLALLEAMAAGTPVIGARSMGINEVIRSEGPGGPTNGLMFEAGKAEHLASQLWRVLGHSVTGAHQSRPKVRVPEDFLEQLVGGSAPLTKEKVDEMRRAGRRFVTDRHGVRQMARRHHDLYRRLLERRNSAKAGHEGTSLAAI